MKKRDYRIKFLLLNTAILGGAAALVHMAYEVSEKITVIGLFAPVNESVWEHLKIMFFPNLIWWIVMYFVKKKSCAVVLRSWIFAAALSLLAAPLLVLLLFYAYTGAFGGPSIAVDIALTFVGYFLALALSFHVYKRAKPPAALAVLLSSAAVAALLIAFISFTFFPPRLPLFSDPKTETYGIGQKLEKNAEAREVSLSLSPVCANVHRLTRGGKIESRPRFLQNNNAQRQLKIRRQGAVDIQNRISTVFLIEI